MNKIIKRSLAFSLGFAVFLFPLSVSALAESDIYYSIDYNGSVSYVPSTSAPFNIAYTMGGNKVLCVSYSSGGYNFNTYFTDYYFPSGSDVTFEITYNNNNLVVNYIDSNGRSLYSNYYTFRNGNFYSSLTHVQGFSQSYVSEVTQVYANSDFMVDPVYKPTYDGLLVGFPVGLEFSVEDFMQWLVDNDKIALSADTGGVSVGGKIPAYIGMAKLKSFLEFYKQFGSSNTSFVTRIWSWFSHMNIVSQTNENVVILKNTIDSLYREYINSYKHEFYSDSANQAHHRRNVNTQTTDDDLTLVTDDANDDIYTTLLREIIRGIVALQSSTISGIQAVIDTLNNLDFSVNVSNNGGVIPNIDLSSLYNYDSAAFEDDLQTFVDGIEDVQDVPQGYIDTINQNALMPENMLSDKSTLTVNIPTIAGFTISDNGNSYSTQTGTYALSSSDYPWLDPIVQKIKRFASIILIMGYLVHLRYRIPELVRGE